MREVIEHVKVVYSNGKNINFQDVSSAGFWFGCYTKDTVFACRNFRKKR